MRREREQREGGIERGGGVPRQVVWNKDVPY